MKFFSRGNDTKQISCPNCESKVDEDNFRCPNCSQQLICSSDKNSDYDFYRIINSDQHKPLKITLKHWLLLHRWCIEDKTIPFVDTSLLKRETQDCNGELFGLDDVFVEGEGKLVQLGKIHGEILGELYGRVYKGRMATLPYHAYGRSENRKRRKYGDYAVSLLNGYYPASSRAYHFFNELNNKFDFSAQELRELYSELLILACHFPIFGDLRNHVDPNFNYDEWFFSFQATVLSNLRNREKPRVAMQVISRDKAKELGLYKSVPRSCNCLNED